MALEYIHTYINTYIHAYVHTYTYIPTYRHTYIHVQMYSLLRSHGLQVVVSCRVVITNIWSQQLCGKDDHLFQRFFLKVEDGCCSQGSCLLHLSAPNLRTNLFGCSCLFCHPPRPISGPISRDTAISRERQRGGAKKRGGGGNTSRGERPRKTVSDPPHLGTLFPPPPPIQFLLVNPLKMPRISLS